MGVGAGSFSTNPRSGHYCHRFTIGIPAFLSWLGTLVGCVSAARGATLVPEFTGCVGQPGSRRKKPMAYDLLIRDGTIIDRSGMPAFRRHVRIQDGNIVPIRQ